MKENKGSLYLNVIIFGVGGDLRRVGGAPMGGWWGECSFILVHLEQGQQ